MKTTGIVLLVIGIIGTIIYGLRALSNSESFSFLGLDIAVSSANWTPTIISVLILIIGIILMRVGKK